jgi:hypothetical protein
VSVSVRCGSVQYRASCTCNSRDQEIHEIEQWLRLGFMGVFFLTMCRSIDGPGTYSESGFTVVSNFRCSS